MRLLKIIGNNTEEMEFSELFKDENKVGITGCTYLLNEHYGIVTGDHKMIFMINSRVDFQALTDVEGVETKDINTKINSGYKKLRGFEGNYYMKYDSGSGFIDILNKDTKRYLRVFTWNNTGAVSLKKKGADGYRNITVDNLIERYFKNEKN